MEKQQLEIALASGPIPLPTGDIAEWTPESVVALICNPIYAGVPPYPAIVDQEKWIKVFCKAAENYSLELMLRILLDDLRQVYGPESGEEDNNEIT